jgi:hypothetical protein
LDSSTGASSNQVTGFLAPSAAGVLEPGTFAIFILGLVACVAILPHKRFRNMIQ